MQIAKPPSPPSDSARILKELEDYYQQLVEYHQKAAMVAQEKLMHVKALTGDESDSPEAEQLERLPELSSLRSPENFPEEQSEELILEKDDKNESVLFFEQLALPEVTLLPLASTTSNSHEGMSRVSNGVAASAPEVLKEAGVERQETVIEDSKPNNPEIPSDTPRKPTEFDYLKQEAVQRTRNDNQATTKEQIIQQIEDILQQDKGKAVHLDYIIRVCRGIVIEKEMADARDEFRLLLRHGSSLGKWDKVPDAPNCWTINLKEMPEYKEEETEKFKLESQAGIPDTALTTKEVAKLLKISPQEVRDLKKKASTELSEGIDYYYGKRRQFYWTELGIEKLRECISEKKPEKESIKQYDWGFPAKSKYEGLPLLQAVEKFLNSYPGQIFSIDEVVLGVCGEVDQENQKIAREKVTKSLSSGHIRKRWRKIPHDIGKYTANIT